MYKNTLYIYLPRCVYTLHLHKKSIRFVYKKLMKGGLHDRRDLAPIYSTFVFGYRLTCPIITAEKYSLSCVGSFLVPQGEVPRERNKDNEKHLLYKKIIAILLYRVYNPYRKRHSILLCRRTDFCAGKRHLRFAWIWRV